MHYFKMFGTGSILNVNYNIHPTAYAGDVVIDMVDAAITDDLGGLYWIAGITPGIVAVYPGHLEPPNLPHLPLNGVSADTKQAESLPIFFNN